MQLICFRVLQGVGGGMMTPVGTAMLFRAFPPHERAKASAVADRSRSLIAPTLGPDPRRLARRLMPAGAGSSMINLPFGILGFFFAALVLKEHTEEHRRRVRPSPASCFPALGLPLILFALSKAPEDGWLSPVVDRADGSSASSCSRR